MMEDIISTTKELCAYKSLISQICDYIEGNVAIDAFPTIMTCNIWDEHKYRMVANLRNSIAMLLEKADDKTRQEVREELYQGL